MGSASPSQFADAPQVRPPSVGVEVLTGLMFVFKSCCLLLFNLT